MKERASAREAGTVVLTEQAVKHQCMHEVRQQGIEADSLVRRNTATKVEAGVCLTPTLACAPVANIAKLGQFR